MSAALPPQPAPEIETLWAKRACPAARRMVETSDNTDAAAERLIAHVESCETCLQAVTAALDEYLG